MAIDSAPVARRTGRALLLAGALAGCAVRAPVPAALPPPAVLAPPPVLSRFGDWEPAGGRARGWQHYGIDLRAPLGTPVLAAADGTVVRVGEHPNAGKLVVVSHAPDLATVYWHLSAIDARSGQTVRRGEPVGRSGTSGNATTPHLHFGLCRRPHGQCGTRIDAGWDDPARYWLDGIACARTRRIPSA